MINNNLKTLRAIALSFIVLLVMVLPALATAHTSFGTVNGSDAGTTARFKFYIANEPTRISNGSGLLNIGGVFRWTLDAGASPVSFVTPTDVGKDSISVIWKEINKGTATHQGYYAVMNDQLTGSTPQTYNAVTLRTIPAITSASENSTGQVVLQWPAVPKNPDVSAHPNSGNVIAYRIWRSTDGINFGSNPVGTVTNTGTGTITYSDNPGSTTNQTYYYAIELVYYGNVVAGDSTQPAPILSSNSSVVDYIPPANPIVTGLTLVNGNWNQGTNVTFNINGSQTSWSGDMKSKIHITPNNASNDITINTATASGGNTIAVAITIDENAPLTERTITVDLASGNAKFTVNKETVSPAAITNLQASAGTNSGDVNLSWTAVGDNGNTGTATSYVVKYSTSAINATNFDSPSATTYTQSWTPAAAGQIETKTLTGLAPGATLYFSIKAVDNVGNKGAFGNSPSAVVKQADVAVIGVDTTPISYSVQQGSTTTSQKTLTISNTGNAALNWTASKGQTWVTLSKASGTVAAGGTDTLTITVDPTGKTSAGSPYTDTITFGGNGGSKTIPVTLTVAAANDPQITSIAPNEVEPNWANTKVTITGKNTHFDASTTTITFPANSGITRTADPITVTAVDATTQNLVFKINVAAKATAQDNTVTVKTGSETVTGTGTITVLPVPKISATPTSLSFTAQTGTNPASKTVTINNDQNGTFNWTAIKTNSWLTITNSGAAGATVTAAISTTGLTAGTYTDLITVEGTNNAGKVTIPVTLTISDAPVPSITVSPTSVKQGWTDVESTISGTNTHFVSTSAVTVDPAVGVTIKSAAVNATTQQITFKLDIASDAVAGVRTIEVTSGSEIVSTQLTIVEVPKSASLTSATPSSGKQGETIPSVVITGANTHFNSNSIPDFGTGITVGTYEPTATSLKVYNVVIAPNATTGVRTVKITTVLATGTEVASGEIFTVTQFIPPPATNEVVLDDYEGTIVAPTSYYGYAWSGSNNDKPVTSLQSANVHGGALAMKITHTAATDPANSWRGFGAVMAQPKDISSMDSITFYMKGDGTNNKVKLQLKDASGRNYSVADADAISLSDTSLKKYTVPISKISSPVGVQTASLDLAKISDYQFTVSGVSASTGIYLDDVVAGKADVNTEPVITSVSPQTVKQGARMIVNGENFGTSGKITVDLGNGLQAIWASDATVESNPIKAWDAAQVSVVIPSNIGLGSKTLKVTRTSGGFAVDSNTIQFVVEAATAETNSYAYPNPVNPKGGESTKIVLPTAAINPTVYIFDTTARIVKKIDVLSPAGTNEATWDCTNTASQIVGDGVYLYRVVDGSSKLLGRGKILVVNK